jgi:predicted Rossmann fold flavoprotein
MAEHKAKTTSNPVEVPAVVIGGGAAGFFAALRLKALCPKQRVILLEAGRMPLAKVKISGGGRCNVTHACFSPPDLEPYYPRGGKQLKKFLYRFGPTQTVEWFESRQVKLKTESDGRMFPITDDSQTIIDCLMNEVARLGVELKTQCHVKRLSPSQDGHWLIETGQVDYKAQTVLLATGSAPSTLKWLQTLGQSLIPQVPSLFTFNIKHPVIADLQGVSFPWVKASLGVKVSLAVKESLDKTLSAKTIYHEGPLLITHWGLSGPAVIGLSAKGARVLQENAYRGLLKIQFCPPHKPDELLAMAETYKQANPQKTLFNGCPWPLPKRFWESLLTFIGLEGGKRWADCPKKPLIQMSELLYQFPFEISGKGQFKEEFVTAGGVDLAGVQLETMESKTLPGLFFAGEILNIDGLTGGFNFQNAWTTGWVAAEGMAKRIL